jgi:hypothetical protein
MSDMRKDGEHRQKGYWDGQQVTREEANPTGSDYADWNRNDRRAQAMSPWPFVLKVTLKRRQRTPPSWAGSAIQSGRI